MLSPSGVEAATRSVMAKSLGLLPSPGLSIRTPVSHRPCAAVSGLTSSRKVRSIGDVALLRTTRRGPALDAPSTPDRTFRLWRALHRAHRLQRRESFKAFSWPRTLSSTFYKLLEIARRLQWLTRLITPWV